MNYKNFLLTAALAMFIPGLAVAVPTDFELPSEGLIFYDENPSNGSEKGFYYFDPTTKGLRLVSEVEHPTDRFSGFAWSKSDQTIYAGSEQGKLYSIDLFTGDTTLIGQIPVAGGPLFVRGIAIHPLTGDLYGMGFGPRLYRINPDDASSELIGIADSLDGGMDFLPDGTLLGWSDKREVMEVNTESAMTQAVTAGGLPQMSNWTYAPDGFLYGANWQRGAIEQIDPVTGQASQLAAFGEHSNGLFGAFYYSAIPEPSTALLIAMAMACCTCCHRKRS